MPTALITGITGQDGSYLAELLLDKGYDVVGLIRSESAALNERIAHISDRIEFVPADLLSEKSVEDALTATRPDEIYNLAAHSLVETSWGQPVLTGEFTALAVARLLEAMRKASPNARFYQASSSEQFGKISESPQRETTPFYPRNPYGVAKAYGHWLTVSYRERFELFAVSGILFNHESPRRGLEFVTRKITHAAARISLGQAESVELGNLDSRRDWGYAGDYVRAMWMMLQHSEASDFVIGTGVSSSVRDFCKLAFDAVGLDYRDHVRQSPQFIRPSETEVLVADPSRARNKLGWSATTNLGELVEMMVNADIARLENAR